MIRVGTSVEIKPDSEGELFLLEPMFWSSFGSVEA
jgi:hypothetical protein